MASRDPRVGVQATDQARRVWPEQDITGNNYDRRKASIFRGIGGGLFVIVPNALPGDFDLEATIASLSSSKASAKAESKPE